MWRGIRTPRRLPMSPKAILTVPFRPQKPLSVPLPRYRADSIERTAHDAAGFDLLTPATRLQFVECALLAVSVDCSSQRGTLAHAWPRCLEGRPSAMMALRGTTLPGSMLRMR